MSRFDDEQQPGPFAVSAEREPEPRLLTRPELPDPASRRGRPHHTQHESELGLRAWAAKLASRRQRRPPGNSAPPRHRSLRWLLGLLLASLALLCVTALAVVLTLRHALVASLPQLDGSLPVAGLRAPVAITRDEHGVPSLTAASLNDLLFAQGYITASDRLWQMDSLRRHAAGELAEILGPSLIEHDRRQRYLQLRAAADRAIIRLPPDQLDQLEAYARGVNTFLDTHRNTLPVEFRLLAYKPAPWSPRDSLLVSLAMFQDLSTEFPPKLNREALSAHLPADLLPDLYPVGSWRDHPPAAQGGNISAPHDVEQIPLDPSQARLRAPSAAIQTRPEELLALTSLAGTDRCTGCRSGSNNWVVSGARSASGAPLVSNDMHLGLSIPDIWYEAALHADLAATSGPGARLDVTGFTLPGVPFVIVGRNTHVAWGVTNLGADVQDVRIEHLRGTGESTEFERPDGSWSPVQHHPERIRVRGGHDLVLDVLTTEHTAGATEIETPVISPLLPSERRSLSLAWTAYDPAVLNSPFLGVNTALDGASLVASLASFGGPSLNLVWADDQGHIGYHALGRIPIRGPAVQHPRSPAVSGPSPAPGVSPADENDDSAVLSEPPLGQSSAQASSGPHLVFSAYRGLRRRRAPVPVAPPPRTRPEARPAPQAPLPLAPQPLNYTIGSPLSPVPVDALDASQVWSGYIAYTDLPAVVDPPAGFLATANSRITPDDYPWAIAEDWIDPFRTDRVVHLLSGGRNLTPADMLRLQNDVHSDVDQAIAQRLAYALDHASAQALGKDARRLHQASDLLRTWDGNLTVGSPGAALIRAIRGVLWSSLLIPQIAAQSSGITPQRAASLSSLYSWGEDTSALELLIQNQPARWLPRGFSNWSDFLATVTERGLLAANAPGDLQQWHYGRLHTVEIRHPIFGGHPLLSRLLGIQGSTGPQPAPGDGTTVKALGAQFGPSERFTADLSSPDATLANVTTGQAGNERSPWYLDQFAPWLRGTTLPLPLAHPTAAHSLTLLPQ